MQNGSRRVVITGMGAITPIGLTVDSFWDGLLKGQSGAARITHFDPEAYSTQFACEVKGYDPLDYFDRKEARRLDRFSQLGISSAVQAVQDAGIDVETLSTEQKDRTAVIFGSGIGAFKRSKSNRITIRSLGPEGSTRSLSLCLSQILRRGIYRYVLDSEVPTIASFLHVLRVTTILAMRSCWFNGES